MMPATHAKPRALSPSRPTILIAMLKRPDGAALVIHEGNPHIKPEHLRRQWHRVRQLAYLLAAYIEDKAVERGVHAQLVLRKSTDDAYAEVRIVWPNGRIIDELADASFCQELAEHVLNYAVEQRLASLPRRDS